MYTIRIDKSHTDRQSRKHDAEATLINNHESEIWNNWSLKIYTSEHGWTSKLLPQKMHFRIWDFKLLPQKMHFRTWDFKLLLQNTCLDNYSVSDSSSNSMSDSNSDSSSASMNLVVFVFLILYLQNLYSHNRINSLF